MKESPDRWHRRFFKAARPHGRFAVISSSVTAGLLLIIGGVVFASQGSDNSTRLGASRSAVSSTADGSSTAGSSSTVTTTTATGSAITTTPAFGPQGTLTTNTTVAGTPGTSTGVQPDPSTPATIPSTTSPTTIAGVTTTTSRARPANGPQIPTLSADATYSADDPVLNLKISAGDTDGYVTRVVVNWNDQSEWTVVDYPLASCSEPLSSLVAPSAMHSYTTAGSYTVTITVSSTNCVGDGEQQAIITKQVSVGGSAQTTTTTSTTVPPNP